jgi:hypothetical protein
MLGTAVALDCVQLGCPWLHCELKPMHIRYLLLQTQLTSYATTKAHYESKHPKEAVPPQEQFDK